MESHREFPPVGGLGARKMKIDESESLVMAQARERSWFTGFARLRPRIGALGNSIESFSSNLSRKEVRRWAAPWRWGRWH